MEQKKLKITCKECGKSFIFPQPSKSGVFKVNCPFCQHTNRFKTAGFNSEATEQKPKAKEGIQPDGSYLLKCKGAGCNTALRTKTFSVGINHVTCPKCQTVNEFVIKPTEGMLLKCQDPNCGKAIPKPEGSEGIFEHECECGQHYKIIMKNGMVEAVNKITIAFPSQESHVDFPMKLEYGKFLSKKSFQLTKGSHTVGRNDPEEQSSFPINDATVSRRSIQIDVNSVGGKMSYKMTVLRSTNPVYHNSAELTVGDIIYLNYGDTIKLGNTTIKVKKA